MKKLLLIAILMLALVLTAVACDKTPDGEDTTVADTTVETPTEAPTEEPTEEVTTEEPTDEVVEPVDIDLTTVTATGSWPTVDVPVNAPALGLGEDQHVIALHYGSIVLGEMDLSKFSKVTVTYVTP